MKFNYLILLFILSFFVSCKSIISSKPFLKLIGQYKTPRAFSNDDVLISLKTFQLPSSLLISAKDSNSLMTLYKSKYFNSIPNYLLYSEGKLYFQDSTKKCNHSNLNFYFRSLNNTDVYFNYFEDFNLKDLLMNTKVISGNIDTVLKNKFILIYTWSNYFPKMSKMAKEDLIEFNKFNNLGYISLNLDFPK